MFIAEIYFCMAINLSACLIATDDRGPYETKSECMERIEEMRVSMFPHGWIARGIRCRPPQGEDKVELFTSYSTKDIHPSV